MLESLGESLSTYLINDSVEDEAMRRFKAWVGGDQAALPPYLRRVVFSIVLGENATDEEYDAILASYRTSQSADGKEIALSAIGDVKVPSLVDRTVDFIFSGDIPAQDIHSPCMSLAANIYTRNLWWDTVKRHWRFYPHGVR